MLSLPFFPWRMRWSRIKISICGVFLASVYRWWKFRISRVMTCVNAGINRNSAEHRRLWGSNEKFLYKLSVRVDVEANLRTNFAQIHGRYQALTVIREVKVEPSCITLLQCVQTSETTPFVNDKDSYNLQLTICRFHISEALSFFTCWLMP